MKVSLSWTTILGVIFVLVLGCGDTDNPIEEDTQEPPTESPTHIDSPILGDWRLMDIIWLEEGVVIGQIDGAGWIYGTNPNILTLAPDGIFNLTHTYPLHPIQDKVILDILESKGKGHIREFTVTYKGKYHIGLNQLRFNLVATRAEPRGEGLELIREFENTLFLYDVWYNDGGAMDYFLTDGENQLELTREQGESMVKFIHRRPKTEQSKS